VKSKFFIYYIIEYRKLLLLMYPVEKPMKIGYARVSTREQKLDMQIIALENSGCERIYEEVISGAKTDRPILDDLLKQLRDGDVLVVWKLDRLGRSLKHLVELIHILMQRNIGLCSLHDPIDTTTPQGRLIFNIFASLSEFERDIIRERTQAGLSAARVRGRLGGRPKGISKECEATACAAETLYREKKLSVMQIAKKLSISKSTLYKYLRYRNVSISAYQQVENKAQK
jgi:DNA invertase Pin-like site-specific DNA recombinase